MQAFISYELRTLMGKSNKLKLVPTGNISEVKAQVQNQLDVYIAF